MGDSGDPDLTRPVAVGPDRVQDRPHPPAWRGRNGVWLRVAAAGRAAGLLLRRREAERRLRPLGDLLELVARGFVHYSMSTHPMQYPVFVRLMELRIVPNSGQLDPLKFTSACLQIPARP